MCEFRLQFVFAFGCILLLVFSLFALNLKNNIVIKMSIDNIEKLYQNYGVLADAKDDISKVPNLEYYIY